MSANRIEKKRSSQEMKALFCTILLRYMQRLYAQTTGEMATESTSNCALTQTHTQHSHLHEQCCRSTNKKYHCHNSLNKNSYSRKNKEKKREWVREEARERERERKNIIKICAGTHFNELIKKLIKSERVERKGCKMKSTLSVCGQQSIVTVFKYVITGGGRHLA